jgi:hypothetical protein
VDFYYAVRALALIKAAAGFFTVQFYCSWGLEKKKSLGRRRGEASRGVKMP